MKYNEKNAPLVCMQTQSTCYRGTTTMEVKGILWHSTGANNPNLKRYVQPSDDAADKADLLTLLGVNKYKNDWNHITRQAGLNAWIGKLDDGSITTIQTMPWDFKPWGCGSGPKGSCNNGWIQFEICEDDLTDKNYFNAVYNEACELTAYLCRKYNIDPKGTVEFNGVQVPTILCHADAHKLGLGSNHGDVNHWFPKYGKSMSTVRADVKKLVGTLPAKDDTVEEPVKLFRVRKTWEDVASQVGAYAILDNAKNACDKAGEGYEVYNEEGIAIYPEQVIEQILNESTFKRGDEVKLVAGATYIDGKTIPSWVFRYKLYVRDIRKNGDIVFSTQQTGSVTGVTNPKNLVAYDAAVAAASNFESYLVRVNTSILNVRAGAGTGYKINGTVKRNELYTIVDEKNGWGKLKNGAGWIHLDYVKKF